MATFLDVSGLQAFSKIFVFILIILVLYATTIKSNVFGGAKWIAWLVGILIGILVIVSDLATGVIQHVIPWFGVLFIFVIFITMASKLFGATSVDMGQFKWVIYVVVIIFFIAGSLLYVRENITIPGDTDDDGNELKDDDYLTTSNFIFHPKFMGIIFVLLVAIFTVALLAGKSG